MAKVRLPVGGSYNTRAASVNALASTSAIAGVGVAGQMIAGRVLPVTRDTRFVNCMVVSVADAASNTKRLYLVKRPGFVVHNTPASGEKGVAIHVWVGQGGGTQVISAFGVTNSTIYDGTTSRGAITGRCTGITETNISGTGTLAISSSDSTGWYLQGTTLTQITDSDFPGVTRTLAGTFAHLDGYPFIMDTGCRIHNGDLNSITDWTAGNYITANAYPDIGVGLVRHRNLIVAFCREHFEVFRNAGNATGSPLSRVDEMTQRIGSVSADAITQVRDTLFWAGSSKQGALGVYSYDGGQVKKVSNAAIESQLAIAGPANVKMTAMSFAGRHVVLVKAASVTYVYCVEEESWSEWRSTTPLWTKAAGVMSGATLVCYSISDVSTSGKVYVFNPTSTSFQDDGVAFTATWQTAPFDGGTNKNKSWGRYDMVADRESSTSEVTVVWSDDDYQTTSSPRTIDLSTDTTWLFMGGYSRRRSFTHTHSADTPWRVHFVDMEFKEARV